MAGAMPPTEPGPGMFPATAAACAAAATWAVAACCCICLWHWRRSNTCTSQGGKAGLGPTHNRVEGIGVQRGMGIWNNFTIQIIWHFFQISRLSKLGLCRVLRQNKYPNGYGECYKYDYDMSIFGNYLCSEKRSFSAASTHLFHSVWSDVHSKQLLASSSVRVSDEPAATIGSEQAIFPLLSFPHRHTRGSVSLSQTSQGTSILFSKHCEWIRIRS